MVNRSIRTLPYPASSFYTHEIIKLIKAIPNDDIEYDDEDIAWMNRSMKNLDCFELWARAGKINSAIRWVLWRRAIIKEALEFCERQRKCKKLSLPAD